MAPVNLPLVRVDVREVRFTIVVTVLLAPVIPLLLVYASVICPDQIYWAEKCTPFYLKPTSPYCTCRLYHAKVVRKRGIYKVELAAIWALRLCRPLKKFCGLMMIFGSILEVVKVHKWFYVQIQQRKPVTLRGGRNASTQRWNKIKM